MLKEQIDSLYFSFKSLIYVVCIHYRSARKTGEMCLHVVVWVLCKDLLPGVNCGDRFVFERAKLTTFFS